MDVSNRRELVARWVEIAAKKAEAEAVKDAEKPAQVAQVSATGGRGKKGGISQAARELGMSRDQVSRAVKIAGLSPEAKAAGRDARRSAQERRRRGMRPLAATPTA